MLWACAAAGYSVAVILGHDVAQTPSFRAEAMLGTATWNVVVTVLALGASVAGLALLADRIGRAGRPRRPLLWLGICSVLAISAHELLMIKSIEAVHFIQYGALTLMLVPVVGGATEAAVVAVVVGVVDEAYQYLVLHPWQGYLDWNDVVMNLVGVLLAASLWASVRPARATGRAWHRRGAAGALVALLVVVSVAYGTGLVGNHLDTGRHALQRWNRPADSTEYVFWSRESGRDYHRLRIAEAYGVLLLLMTGAVVYRVDP